MKLCLACSAQHGADVWRCPACGATPAIVDGYPAYAPELAHVNAGFNPEVFEELARLEADHFWFRARNRLIIWALNTYFTNAKSFLEVGCGTGFVLSGVARARPDLAVYGSEIYARALPIAAQRAPRATLFQMDARVLPFAEEFDVIGAFDVLEHIEEDEEVLHQIYRGTRTGGGIVLTVPQHPFLWSAADENAHHVRRYVAKELVQKVQRAGFEVLMNTSFVSTLAPLMIATRLLGRGWRSSQDALAELRIRGVLNRVLEYILDTECGMIRAGVRLPIGGSLMLVARKQ